MAHRSVESRSEFFPEATVKRVLKYVYRFGSVRGVRTLLRVLADRGCVKLHLPGYQAPVLLRTRTSDVPTFEKVFVSREYEFPYPNREPRLIIDAGANVGYASIFFARKFPSSRVLAVEPQRANYELLLRNVAAYPNVVPRRAALWNSNVTLRIENPDDQHGVKADDQRRCGHG
jgi:hypothetical protein